MVAVLEYLAANAAILVALTALGISLRANYTAHLAHKLNLQNKADNERVLLFEKKRELLNEVDRQYTRFATLMMLTAQKILLFREHPSLHETMQDEFDRLKSNLNAVQVLAAKYEEQRKGIESINVGADIAAQEELLANIRRLTIHVEKDIAHEQALLNELRSQVGASGGALPVASIQLKR
jgi:hypothetical protein